MKWSWSRFHGERDGPSEVSPEFRRDCEEEVNIDLQKPVQQLICDVHEELRSDNRSEQDKLNGAVKRAVGMMGRVALENDRISKQLLFLTWITAILTAATVFQTLAPYVFRLISQ